MGEEVEESLLLRLRGRADAAEAANSEGTPLVERFSLLREAASEIESLRASLTRVEEERDAERERCAGLAVELVALWREFPEKHKSDEPERRTATFTNICVEKRITAQTIADKIRRGDQPTRLSRATSAEGK